MVLKKTNIEAQLAFTKKNSLQAENLLKEVHKILEADTQKEERIVTAIAHSKPIAENPFNFDLLETANIYHITHIKHLCIDYRLRFLDSKYFKGDIPQEALDKIKKLEHEHAITINGFKIIAPSKLFKLEDKDDPLLFAPIGNGYFYLIHKWGDDLHPLRKAFAWPFKNIVNLAILVLLLSFFLTTLIPEGLFSKESTLAQFGILFFFTFKSITAIVIFYGFALGKNFNSAIWNSKYFNV